MGTGIREGPRLPEHERLDMIRKLPLFGFVIGFLLAVGFCGFSLAQNPGPFGHSQAIAALGMSAFLGFVGTLAGFAFRGVLWILSRIGRHRLPSKELATR